MFKRILSGVIMMAADVIQFPSGDELERRKKEALDPERLQRRRKWAEKNREERERKEKNKRITDSLKD